MCLSGYTRGSLPGMKMPLWKKILIISSISLLVLAVLTFLAIWVVFPIVFMCSISVQRFFMFFPIQDPKNPQFSNPELYDINGVINFHITTTDLDGKTMLSIGSWMILHEDEINTTQSIKHEHIFAADILKKTTKPVLFYLHGVACNRIKAIQVYKQLRKHFLIIAVDHRGYGDSGLTAAMSEDGIVSDSVQIYQWIRRNTRNDIFVWGHSLGGALGLHTTRKLKEINVIPMGVTVESSFSTMREEIKTTSIAKIFSWLAYFKSCFLDPLEANGFRFWSTDNIRFVDSPLLHLHAEDDPVVPYRLGARLADVAQNQRDLSSQGNVTFHLFPSVGYMHTAITSDPEIHNIVNAFISSCRDQNKMRN